MLQPLTIIKNWFTNTKTREKNWDEIANKISAFGTRTNNNLKQLGLDISGSAYDFNNNGVATQSPSVVDRIAAVELLAGKPLIGVLGLGLSFTTNGTITLKAYDGTDLSATNAGYVILDTNGAAGKLTSIPVIANQSVSLTGAHWGYDTYGDITELPLYVLLINDSINGTIVLGVGAKPPSGVVDPGNITITPSSVTTIDKVLVASAFVNDNNALTMARVLGSFTDTTNVWSFALANGDIVSGYHAPYVDAAEIRF